MSVKITISDAVGSMPKHPVKRRTLGLSALAVVSMLCTATVFHAQRKPEEPPTPTRPFTSDDLAHIMNGTYELKGVEDHVWGLPPEAASIPDAGFLRQPEVMTGYANGCQKVAWGRRHVLASMCEKLVQLCTISPARTRPVHPVPFPPAPVLRRCCKHQRSPCCS